jgi:AmmeMemoRadiSam system protein B
MTNERPQLRFIEAIPVQQGEQRFVVLRDPEDLFGDPLAVPLPTFMLMSFFDGQNTVRDVQAAVQREFQQLVPADALEALVRQLDDAFLLENERTKIRREEVRRDFERQATRPAVHAGLAYPGDPEELVQVFDEFFKGCPAGNGDARVPRGLVTPHIDIRQGGPCMAAAFQRLKQPDAPELYIVLGVAHHPTANQFTLTVKDFETPLGLARTDKRAAARLQEIYGAEKLSGEYAHKSEHSIEFQTVFLKYLHRDREFTILPILCGSIDEDLHAENGEASQRRDEAKRFAQALRQLVIEMGQRVCVIAGVDLSHVGLKFGDAQAVDDLRAGLIRAADMRMLETLQGRDPEAFFDHFRPDRNARNVDAVAAVYTMLQVIGPGEGELISYDQYREHETGSLVSYASMALY